MLASIMVAGTIAELEVQSLEDFYARNDAFRNSVAANGSWISEKTIKSSLFNYGMGVSSRSSRTY